MKYKLAFTPLEQTFVNMLVKGWLEEHGGSVYPPSAGWDDVAKSILKKLEESAK